MIQGGAMWRAQMRALHRDPNVKKQKLAPGHWRRIASFARPYRAMLVTYLVLIVVDAAVGAANPLVYRAIIDNGILGHDSGLIVALAFLV
ncbi:MAG TPA: hypothetical protein VMD59_22850, partial [Acidimicrobiales bacterium]|nr:hypothetical protein [Acidimicrobiales bacterium]